MDKIHVLQLGEQNWSSLYHLTENVWWEYQSSLTQEPSVEYDIAFLDRLPSHGEIKLLMKGVKAHTLYVTEEVAMEPRIHNLMQCKMGKVISREEIQSFLNHEIGFFYSTSYGEKFRGRNMSISTDFHGDITWTLGDCVTLLGDFGESYRQIACWRNNIPITREIPIDLWLEYETTEEVSIRLKITELKRGSVSQKIGEWIFTEEDMEEIVSIVSSQNSSLIFVSLLAKGKGSLQIRGLHDRYSRGKHGVFLPGGERYVTSDRQEAFCYFDPGDRKPPLNVYFSGYKTREGFEGYRMMRKMGSPFLLVSEARLEGGAFYMGTEEYESLVVNMLQKYVEELGFQMSDVIFSGLSMGTFGALYYGCEIRPHALILGKPLTSVGNVASNGTYLRPEDFPTAMDVLMFHQGGTTEEYVEQMNRRFWEKFDGTDWGQSKFVVAYMIEDDYDQDAYQQLLSHLHNGGVQVYGKGLHGRHNDATGGIVMWFLHQYKKIMLEDFGRRLED